MRYLKLTLDKQQRIIGKGLSTQDCEGALPETDPVFALLPNFPGDEIDRPIVDEYGNPLYRWDGKRAVRDPMVPTAEQIAVKEKRERKAWLIDHADEVLARLEAAEAKLAELGKEAASRAER